MIQWLIKVLYPHNWFKMVYFRRYGDFAGLYFIMLLLFLCAGCQKNVKKNAFLVSRQGDTLTLESASLLDPYSHPDSIRFRNVFVRKALAAQIKDSLPDSLDQLLAKQLSLESGVEWSGAAAGLLLDAARVLRARLENDTGCLSTIAFAESLFNAHIQPGKLSFPVVKCQRNEKESNSWIGRCFKQVFDLDEQTGSALAVFTTSKSLSGGVKVVDGNLIQGLVYDAAKAKKDSLALCKSKPKIKTVDTTEKNGEALLQYRDRQSIMDSISKHIPEIKALYKKYLKANNSLGGTVTVRFQVSVKGKITDVSLVKSDIHDKVFVEQFLNYVKTINFKEIPEKAGIMTFEFPFEFDQDT